MKSIILRGLAAFIFANVLIVYFPASPVALLTLVIASGFLLLLHHEKGLLIACTCLFCTLVLEGAVRISGDRFVNPYYRPHEMLMTETRYEPNQFVETLSPHGDLLAIDPSLDRELASPRHLTFRTDSLGYRNGSDYAGEPVIIVGDSFVVGTGNTQADTLSEVLRSEHDIPTYSLAFPNGPLGYARMTLEAKERFGAEVCYVMVFFEGNDFQLVDPSELALREMAPSALRQAVKTYLKAVKNNLQLSRVFYGLSTQGVKIVSQSLNGQNDKDIARESITFVQTASGRPIAFLKGYADVVRRKSYDDHGFLSAQILRSRPDLLIFVPDKYRVYAPLLDKAVGSLPGAQLDFLRTTAAEHGLPVIDTTDQMIEQSRELLDKNQMTYWPDDTHWRRDGIEVAASLLAEVLENRPPERCANILEGQP